MLFIYLDQSPGTPKDAIELAAHIGGRGSPSTLAAPLHWIRHRNHLLQLQYISCFMDHSVQYVQENTKITTALKRLNVCIIKKTE